MIIEHLYESGILPLIHRVDGTLYFMDVPMRTFIIFMGVFLMLMFILQKGNHA